MQFKEFAEYLDKLEKTASRLEITSILSELFNKTPAEEIDKVVYLSLGVLAPNYEGIILSLAEKMGIRALALAYGKIVEEVLKLYKKAGDLGNVAQILGEGLKVKGKRQEVKDESLSVSDVYNELVSIAKDNGEGSQEKKITKLADILTRVDPLSARYIARIPVGRLRLGFSEKTVIDALSDGTDTSKTDIEDAYNVRPDIGYIAKLTKENKLHEVTPKIGIPVVPMLAARLNSPAEMIKKMGEVSVEPKFDGLRIFIHFDRKKDVLKIFTRNMNALDPAIFPELTDVGKYIKADSVILDTEAVGLDSKRQMFVDFQKTVSRRRKHEIEKNSTDIPLQFQVFDMLLINGRSLMREPYLKRREEIEKVVVNGNILRVDDHEVTTDPEVIRVLHEKYLKMNLEGVVIKRASAPYVSGRTGWNWVKMKEVEGTRGKLSDTLDCVIMGFTTGKGKRVDFGVGQFLAGIVDGDTFKTITKVGTGLTDEQFRELNKRLKKIAVKTKPKEYEVNKDLEPDFWVTPEVVVELAADEITVSPKHTAGYALRFPRLVKFRDDKKANQATTIKEVKEIAKLQKRS